MQVLVTGASGSGTTTLGKALAARIGAPLVSLIRVETHSCYAGDRTTTHDWGAGCGTCPACELRLTGYRRYLERGPKPDVASR